MWRFSANAFWKCIGCIYFAPYFDVGGDKSWGKYDATQILSGNKRKRKYRGIWQNIDIFEVCPSSVACAISVSFISVPRLVTFVSPDWIS